MRAINIIKPLRTSAAPLRKNIRSSIGGGYETASVLSFPKMLYYAPEAGGRSGETGRPDISVTINNSETSFMRFAAYFGHSSYSESRRIRKLGHLFEDLFRSYAGLNRLTQALWSIYRSNNLQLSHSLLSLIRAINEKNGTELDSYFEGVTNLERVQKKTVSILKSIDYSLFNRLYLRYGNLSVLNIGRRETVRHTNTIVPGRGRPADRLFRLTDSFYSMTPLLTRIYEAIETGVYLYDADTYRNAKTLWRLTNSLWKVYLGQNMELSRSFARLITRVEQENKSVEQRNAENNMFSDNRSLKNLVNALKRAFSGSNLELRNSMITLFGDIHNAGKRRSVAIHKHYAPNTAPPIVLLYREIVPESSYTKLVYKKSAAPEGSERTEAFSRLERELKTKLAQLQAAPPSTPNSGNAEDIVKRVIEQVNKKQQLEWRLEKLQRGIF